LVSSLNLALLLLAFVVGLGFIIRIEIQKFNTGVFPYACFFILYMFVFYAVVPLGMGLWQHANGNLIVNHPFPNIIPISTISFVLAYTTIHLLGYFTTLSYFKSSVVKTDEGQKRNDINVLFIFATFATAISVSLSISLNQSFEIPGTRQLIEPLWRCGFVILAWLAISRQLSVPWISVFVFITLLKSYVSLSDGLLTPTLMDITLIIALLFYLRMFISISITVGLFLVILFSYQNIKCIHLSSGSDALKTKFSLTADFADNGVDETEAPYFDKSCFRNKLKGSVISITRRSSHLNLLQHVIERTPEPAENSALPPIIMAIQNHVPRLFWDKKPKENFGNSFGKKYKILAPTDNKTSWNIPWLSDFFIHGGFSSALIYAIFSGILMGVGVGWISKIRDKKFGFGLYAASFFPLFYQSSNFSLMTGSILWIILIILTIYASISFIIRRVHS